MTAYPRVLVVGDSLTFGSIASLPNNAYPYALVTGLRARGSQDAMFYVLDGAPGVTTASVITAYQEMALAPVVDALVIELGTNDFTESNPAATFQAQYVALVSLLRQSAPHAALVGLGTWQDPATVNATGAAARLYNAIIEDAVLNKSGAPLARYVDLGALYLTPSDHNTTGDTFHPNDAGHTAIANAVLASLP